MIKYILGIIIGSVGAFLLGCKLGDLLIYFAESNFNFMLGWAIGSVIFIFGISLLTLVVTKLMER